MTQVGARTPSLLCPTPNSSHHHAFQCPLLTLHASLGPHAPCIPGLDGYGPYVPWPRCLTSEAIATDIDGLQICHLHDIDATLLARRAIPSGQMASIHHMLVVIRAEGVAVPLPSEPASLSRGCMCPALRATPGPPFLFWWVLICFDRWSLLMKRLGHSGQANFFSPR